MSRKVLSMAMMAMFALLVSAALASAQTTSSSSNGHQMGAMMQPKANWHASMQDLWKSDQAMANEWTQIENHYNKMMAITDQAQLKEEMAKHQEMMTTYHNMMMDNSKMWRQTMAMYQPPSTQGMATQTKAGDDQGKTAMPTKH